MILANLSLREYMRSMIFANEGLQLFIDVANNNIKELKNNLHAKRTSIKGLVNLAMAKQEVRTKIVSQLADEVLSVQKGTCDPVVASYMKALVRSSAAYIL